jgi:hypothetical protein
MRVMHAILLATFAAISAGARADALVEYRITDGQIAEPLTKEPGNPARAGTAFSAMLFPMPATLNWVTSGRRSRAWARA